MIFSVTVFMLQLLNLIYWFWVQNFKQNAKALFIMNKFQNILPRDLLITDMNNIYDRILVEYFWTLLSDEYCTSYNLVTSR